MSENTGAKIQLMSWINILIYYLQSILTRSSIHGLDLFSRLQVPQTDVSIQGAGGSNGSIMTDVYWHHTQLVSLQSPLELQLLIWPAVRVGHRG